MRDWTEAELDIEEWDLAIEAQRLADEALAKLVSKLAELNGIQEGTVKYEILQEQTYDSLLSITTSEEE